MTTITAVTQEERPATLVDWSMASDWISLDLAAFLLGVKVSMVNEIVMLGGVDAVEQGGQTLVERDGLREFWDIYHDAAGADEQLSDHP